MERIHRDCKSAKERVERYQATTRNRTHAEFDDRRYQPLRVVVEDELLALNLASPGEATTEQLRKGIERVAYAVHDGYVFPSVDSVVPEPHLLAVAALEAVRRGANLRGSGGDKAEIVRRLSRKKPDEGRPFIVLPAARSRFLEIADEKSMLDGDAEERDRVFLEAIRLHEAQGAILLTSVDGGREGESASPTSEDHLVIHVNPAWFADLVRRIVDIRLLDPAQQRNVVEEMERCVPFDSMRALSSQQVRFFRAGEVSREYIKFLWQDRDMQLGHASPSPRAPVLQMSEETVELMVQSLLDVRFMFRVRDRDGGVIPDLYVVASCLPGHVGHSVDPRKLLGMKVGGAMYSTRLKLVGARSLPPGLIPRLIAWCGQGDARIKACWKRGVCFAFNRKHLVLVYERREAERCSTVECHALGSAHDEGVGGTLSDLVKELDRLVRDDKYGFPGVGLFVSGEIEERKASSDSDLKALLSHLEDALVDHMDVTVEELTRSREDIAGEWVLKLMSKFSTLRLLPPLAVFLFCGGSGGMPKHAVRRLPATGLCNRSFRLCGSRKRGQA